MTSTPLFTVRRRWQAAALVLCAVLAASILTSPGPARAIESGDDKALELPWVAKLITTLSPTTIQECTGSFISASWILTAAHCVDQASQPVKIEASVMRNGVLTLVGTGTSTILSKTDDVALVRLATPVGTDVVPTYGKLARWVQPGPASAYGYGKLTASSGRGTDFLKSARVQINRIGSRWALGVASLLMKVGDPFPWSDKIHTQGVNGQILEGDSGGPLLQFGAVVGVLSTGDDDKTAMLSRDAQYVPIASVFDWVVESTGLPSEQLDATTVQATRNLALWGVNGANVSVHGGGLQTSFGTAASPFEMLFDQSQSFQLRSGGTCASASNEVDGTSMVVVVKPVLRMKPCSSTDYNQKFGFVLTSEDASGPPQGVIRTVVGNQQIAVLASGELGLSTSNSSAIQFLAVPTGSTSLADLRQSLTASSDVWSQAHRVGKRDDSDLVPRVVTSSYADVSLPPLPAGLQVIDSGATSTTEADTVYVLADDAHLYRSTAVKSPRFGAWEKLPGEDIVQFSVSTVRGGAAYTDGHTVLFADPRGGVTTLRQLDGRGVVGLAVGGTDQTDSIFVIGSDSRVYRYSSPTAFPTSLVGEGVRNVVASRAADGAVVYASSDATFFAAAEAQGFSFSLPSPSTIESLQLGSDRGVAQVSAVTVDGSVWVTSNRAVLGAGNAGWRREVSPDKGLVSFSASGSPAGDNLWSDGTRFFSFADRPMPAAVMPGGVTVLRVYTTKTPTGSFIDWALGSDGRLYRSLDSGRWSAMTGPSIENLALSPSGGTAFYFVRKK